MRHPTPPEGVPQPRRRRRSTLPQEPAPEPRIVAFIDGIVFWYDGPRAARAAGRLRRQAARIGLDPNPLKGRRPFGRGFLTSLAPLWGRPSADLEHRAAGQEPLDLLSLIELAEGRPRGRCHKPARRGATKPLPPPYAARVTRLDIAIDVLDAPADQALEIAREVGFPLDAKHLRGRTRRPGAPAREGQAVTYARQKSADRNLAWYADHPSKIDPTGQPALHVELKIQGDHLPDHLRHPRAILALVDQPLLLLRLFAQHVKPGT